MGIIKDHLREYLENSEKDARPAATPTRTTGWVNSSGETMAALENTIRQELPMELGNDFSFFFREAAGEHPGIYLVIVPAESDSPPGGAKLAARDPAYRDIMNKYGYLAFVASSGNIAVGYLKEGHALSLGSLPHGTPVSFASLAPFIERFLQEAFPLPATE